MKYVCNKRAHMLAHSLQPGACFATAGADVRIVAGQHLGRQLRWLGARWAAEGCNNCDGWAAAGLLWVRVRVRATMAVIYIYCH